MRIVPIDGLLQLEEALSLDLIPAKQDIVREFVSAEMNDVIRSAQSLCGARANSVKEQLAELEGLSGKNEAVMQQMLARVSNKSTARTGWWSRDWTSSTNQQV